MPASARAKLLGGFGKADQHITAAGLAVGALLLLGACGGDARQTMSFATGSPSGIYYPFGGALSSIWSRLDGVNIKAEVTGASLTNVIQVARGDSDVGIAMGDVVTSAYRGEGRFPEALPVRTLFAAYPNLVHVLALPDRGIASMADLRGKRVSLGAPGSGTAVAAENVLTGLGFDIEHDLRAQFLNFTGTADALKDGTLDAAFIVGGLGIAVVKELALTRDILLVPITPAEQARLGQAFAAYSAEAIPTGAYRGVAAPVPTLGTWNLVLVNAAMPERTAFRLLCSTYRAQAELERVVAVASFTEPANAARIDTVPLHPGAEAYLRAVAEKGVEGVSCEA